MQKMISFMNNDTLIKLMNFNIKYFNDQLGRLKTKVKSEKYQQSKSANILVEKSLFENSDESDDSLTDSLSYTNSKSKDRSENRSNLSDSKEGSENKKHIIFNRTAVPQIRKPKVKYSNKSKFANSLTIKEESK